MELPVEGHPLRPKFGKKVEGFSEARDIDELGEGSAILYVSGDSQPII
jgi:hypothetical protein